MSSRPGGKTPVASQHTANPGAGDNPRFSRGRPLVRPITIPGPSDGVPATSRYTFRYWGALIGNGALEELLRITRAAHRKELIRQPRFLPVLLSEGLCFALGRGVIVLDPVPRLTRAQCERLPARLRSELLMPVSTDQNGGF